MCGESVILVTAWQEEMGIVYHEWRGSKFSWHEPDGRQLDKLCWSFFEKSKADDLIWHAYNVKLYLFLSLTRSLKFYEQHRLFIHVLVGHALVLYSQTGKSLGG